MNIYRYISYKIMFTNIYVCLYRLSFNVSLKIREEK